MWRKRPGACKTISQIQIVLEICFRKVDATWQRHTYIKACVYSHYFVYCISTIDYHRISNTVCRLFQDHVWKQNKRQKNSFKEILDAPFSSLPLCSWSIFATFKALLVAKSSRPFSTSTVTPLSSAFRFQRACSVAPLSSAFSKIPRFRQACWIQKYICVSLKRTYLQQKD